MRLTEMHSGYTIREIVATWYERHGYKDLAEKVMNDTYPPYQTVVSGYVRYLLLQATDINSLHAGAREVMENGTAAILRPQLTLRDMAVRWCQRHKNPDMEKKLKESKNPKLDMAQDHVNILSHLKTIDALLKGVKVCILINNISRRNLYLHALSNPKIINRYETDKAELAFLRQNGIDLKKMAGGGWWNFFSK